MGVLDYYSIFENFDIKIYNRPTYITEKENSKIPELILDSTPITLAEQQSLMRGKLTAHKLRDYRKNVFNLVLLPDVDILFDKLINGGENELL